MSDTLVLGTAAVVAVAPPLSAIVAAPVPLPLPTPVLPVAGPQGQRGAPGGSRLEYAPSSPSAAWVIPHSFGYIPDVHVYDTAAREVLADVTSTTDTVTVIFAAPFDGLAVLT